MTKKKMPKKVLQHMQDKPTPKSSGGRVPAPLVAWHKANPDVWNAHKNK